MNPALAILALCVSAWGAEVEVVAVQGALRPGAVGAIDVAVLDDAGQPLLVPPTVSVPQGEVWPSDGRQASPGVFRYLVSTPTGASQVKVSVSWEEGSTTRTLPVDTLGGTNLDVRPVADAGGRLVRFEVHGDAVPDPRQLQVVTSEGRVVEVVRDGDHLDVALEAEERGQARWVLVGVNDLRVDATPVWATLPLRGRFEAQLTTEVGAKVSVDVGRRTYGPVIADAAGNTTLSVSHGPDETTGRVRVVDAAGNETTAPLVLAGQTTPALLSFVDRPRRPTEAPPDVLLHAIRANGSPWRGEAPTCRSSVVGNLDITQIGAGTWRLRLPGTLPRGAWALRLVCDLGGETQHIIRVPVDEGTPQALWARMWPEVLSSDYPVGTLQIALENVFGQRVQPDGRFEARATLGKVTLDDPVGPFVGGEYRGDAALISGEDRVAMAWFAPLGEGPVDHLEIVTGEVRGDMTQAWVRVLDARRRPLAHRPVEINHNGRLIQGVTGRDGWAVLDVRGTKGLIAVRVTSERRSAWGVLVPHHPATRGPGRPDLVTDLMVTLDPGRVSDVLLSIAPSTIKAGPGATAQIRAAALDRDGQIAADTPPELEVSEGRVEEPERQADGIWAWTYVAPPGFRNRDVEVVATDTTLDVSSRDVLRVRSSSVDRWVSLSAGVQSNFGRITSPAFFFDAAWRIRLGPRDADLATGRARLMVRAGVGWYGAGATTSATSTVDGELRMDLVPVHAALVLRQSYPAHAYWFSLGGVVAPYVGSAAYGGVVVTRRVGVLPPGLVASAGYGARVPGGEVAIEVKGTVLTSPGSDISFEGQVGGLAVTLGYRLVY